MPARDSVPTGAPCWVDLQSSDPERAVAFYGAVLGWTAEEPNAEFGGYRNFRSRDVRVAGLMRSDDQAPVRDVWSIYLASDDTEKTIAAAVAAGAQVIVPAMPVADMGVMGFVVDPTGAGIGVWQPGTHRGSGLVAEPGAPSWWELLTRDYGAALDFYRDAFGWRTQALGDTDEFRYTVMVEPDGDGQLAGVMDAAGWLPEGVPPHWAVYFGVADTDAAAATVTELGGSVVAEPTDTPFGRLVHVTDPMGANVRLISTPAPSTS